MHAAAADTAAGAGTAAWAGVVVVTAAGTGTAGAETEGTTGAPGGACFVMWVCEVLLLEMQHLVEIPSHEAGKRVSMLSCAA